MKIRAVIICMQVLATATVIASWFLREPGLGLALIAISLMPILSLVGGQKLWKPWFMAGIKEDFPDMRTIAVVALLIEGLMIVGLAMHVGWTLAGVRGALLLLQISLNGKFAKDTAQPIFEHENSRNSTPHDHAGHAGKPNP